MAHNSCKNWQCPKCQGPAARDWTAARAADLMPVERFHVAFTLLAAIAHIAFWNRRCRRSPVPRRCRDVEHNRRRSMST
ncbi:MAG: transposase zinc-binding domain-containing protein [Devosia sp.]